PASMIVETYALTRQCRTLDGMTGRLPCLLISILRRAEMDDGPEIAKRAMSASISNCSFKDRAL
ncbi:hypothetical protein LIOPPNJA_27740, partial [Robbsia andropogonis]|nr:hypothetical protein [Robbsia andropogonis]